jgi:hypothetical protein
MESKMSVTAIANKSGASLRQADAKSASIKTSTTNSAANVMATATGASAAESSTQVTLSPFAQILAQLAAAGITFTMAASQDAPVGSASLAGLTLPSQMPGESLNGYAMRVCVALSATGFNVSMTDPGGFSMEIAKIPDQAGASTGDSIQQIAKEMQGELILPPTNGDNYDGEVSQPAFEKVIRQLGGTENEASDIFTWLDADHNGSISNQELLSAMSGLGSSDTSSPAQVLMQLLVPNGDSSLTAGEFVGFESAVVAVEKPWI